MKTTVVPAQVTTVEDKIMGNLSFAQLLLLTLPVFLSGALFALMPPLMGVTILKIIIGASFTAVCLTLAIRIKGKLVAQWLGVITRYAVRPRYYLFNKNNTYLRPAKEQLEPIKQTETVVVSEKPVEAQPVIPTSERARLELSMADPRAKFHLKATKGGLRVYISEIKEKRV